MSETLLFFLYYYREIGKDQDRASYMDVMSDLLAMYIDMELKASKKGNEHHGKISARLSSCLHVYLGALNERQYFMSLDAKMDVVNIYFYFLF